MVSARRLPGCWTRTTAVTSGLRYIRGRVRRLVRREPPTTAARPITIPINACRHYNAYRYGSSSFNPYENYVDGLHRQRAVESLREAFEDFLRHFRPRSFSDLLQTSFSKHVP